MQAIEQAISSFNPSIGLSAVLTLHLIHPFNTKSISFNPSIGLSAVLTPIHHFNPFSYLKFQSLNRA